MSGKLESISVADLEAVAAQVRPERIYGVSIAGRDEIYVQIAPTRHGSDQWAIFRRKRGTWQRASEGLVITS